MPRRPGLGKGLGALIPEGTPNTNDTPVEAPSTSPLRQVPVTSIRPNQFQPRPRRRTNSNRKASAFWPLP